MDVRVDCMHVARGVARAHDACKILGGASWSSPLNIFRGISLTFDIRRRTYDDDDDRP